MTETQEHRSFYCAAVQKVSDECDVWPLLMKPTPTEPVSRPVKKVSENQEQEVSNEHCLKAANERREKALAERERLFTEPDVGQEFVRYVRINNLWPCYKYGSIKSKDQKHLR